ncbi:MAG: UDP-2,3-diacylglucosamine diphosphatase [Bacteroidota bacterium]
MKNTYFASDFHLGVSGRVSSRERERQIVRWLTSIQEQAGAIYLVGDIFDFWFEYKTVVPKGYVRLLGKLAELRDAGIPIYFFTGNHDMWMFQYFEEELDIPVYRHPIVREINGKKFFIGHGDGLGPGDHGYKFMKRIFTNKLCQWLFARLHPNFGIGLASFLSVRSREKDPVGERFLGENREWLVSFANEYKEEVIDYFVFGHRHLPIQMTLKNQHSQYINIGEWLHNNSYAVFDGKTMQLSFFENKHGRVFP